MNFLPAMNENFSCPYPQKYLRLSDLNFSYSDEYAVIFYSVFFFYICLMINEIEYHSMSSLVIGICTFVTFLFILIIFLQIFPFWFFFSCKLSVHISCLFFCWWFAFFLLIYKLHVIIFFLCMQTISSKCTASFLNLWFLVLILPKFNFQF